MAKNSVFSDVIREVRKQRGFTQEELAGLLDCSVETISKLERGVTKPRLGTLELISQKLKIPMRDLVNYLQVNKGVDPKRLKLEARLLELAHKTDLQILGMMIRQFEAVVSKKDD